MLKAVTKIGMITANQSEALAFYTEKLGFVIRADVTNGDFRWLTVGLENQPELEFVLMEVKADGNLTPDEAAALTKMLHDGKVYTGHVIETDDIDKAYAEFSAKGVEFLSTPTARPWEDTDAQFKDNSGNSWLLFQQGGGQN